MLNTLEFSRVTLLRGQSRCERGWKKCGVCVVGTSESGWLCGCVRTLTDVEVTVLCKKSCHQATAAVHTSGLHRCLTLPCTRPAPTQFFCVACAHSICSQTRPAPPKFFCVLHLEYLFPQLSCTHRIFHYRTHSCLAPSESAHVLPTH